VVNTCKVHIWSGPDGQIIAVGRPQVEGKNQQGSLEGTARSVEPLAGGAQAILELDAPEEELQVLHETYYVDLEKRVLVSRGKGTGV
jgi:hypothetical protein